MSPCIVALFLVVVFSSACGLLSREAPSTTASSAPPFSKSSVDIIQTVTVVPVTAKKLEKIEQIPGELMPYQSVALFPKIVGFVEWMGVDRGSRVKEGQLLVRLVAPELKAQRAEAESRLQAVQWQGTEAEAQLRSEEGSYNKLKAAAATPGVVSGNELQVAEKNVEARLARRQSVENSEKAAQAAVRSVEEIQGYLNIYAPFDGVITERNVHKGALVGTSSAATTSPMLRIEQVSRLRLVVPVSERDLGNVPSGGKVSFKVPAFPSDIFQGSIQRMAYSLDPKTRTMPIEVDVNNSSGKLSPGMFADVSWPVRRSQESLFVPASALVTTTERTFVIRIKDGTTEWVDVRLGAALIDLVEIVGDVKAGEIVVRRGTDELRAGTRVKIEAK